MCPEIRPGFATTEFMFCLNVKAAENVTSWSIQVKPTLLDNRQISYRIIPTKRTFLLTRFPTKQIIADEMSTECFGPPFTKSHTKSFFIQRKISKHCQEIMRLRANRNNLGHYSGKTLICMQHLYKSIADDLWRKRQYTAQEHARSKSRVFPVEGSFLTRTGSKAKCKAVLREKRHCIDKKELPVPAPSDNSPQSHESLHGYSGHECQQFVLNSDEMINEKHPKARMQQTSSAFFFDSYSRQELQVIARTPGALHAAVCEGDMDWMSVLLELGADLNCEYRETTPLMAAATCQTVGYLIQHGADVNQVVVTNDGQKTALLNAVSPQYVATLVTKMGKDNAFEELEKIVKRLVHEGANVSVVDTAGNTPLMAACETDGAESILKFLSSAGEMTHRINSGGESVLHLAVRSNCIEHVLAVTCESHVDVNLQNVMGTTPLMIAAMNKNKDIVEYLLHQGAAVNTRDHGGNTCLIHAVKSCSNDVEYIRMLLDAGADPNIENETGFCPLTLAAADLNDKVLGLLLETSCALEEDRKERALGLLLAGNGVTQNTRTCVSMLLKHNTSSSKINPSLIHKFTTDGHTELVRQLIINGTPPADVSRDDPRVLCYCWPVDSASPMCAALLANQLCLAQTFAELWFFTPSDFSLASNARLKEHLSRNGYSECVDLLLGVSSHIMSLRVLCFTSVSAAVGHGSHRAKTIQSLQVPDLVKNMLLFKDETNLKDVQCNTIISPAQH
uniref:Uncharacterized protein n=1 Tax=Biomphalaria glabrata TaxID=6526 RepID=A0A2C9KR69_BIOGL